MKKILLVLALIPVLCASAQKNKWSLSLLGTVGIGGPQASIFNTMKDQGFGETLNYDFFGLQGSSDFPRKEKAGSYLVHVTVRQQANRCLYFVAGISNQGTVSGFKSEGVDPYFGMMIGSFPRVKYRVFQFTGGYQYDLKNSPFKFGFGPSLFLFNYGLEMTANSNRQTSVVPGASFNFRLPLGKQKRTFGLELIAEGNMAPNAKMKTLQESGTSTPLQESHVNMMHANAGLLFTFRG